MNLSEFWTHGRVECLTCDHIWTGVWELDCPNLECPRCGSTDSVREAHYEQEQ